MYNIQRNDTIVYNETYITDKLMYMCTKLYLKRLLENNRGSINETFI